MKRLTIAVFALCLGLANATGCGTGNEKECRQAIENIFRLTSMDKTSSGPSVDKWVRSCRANASNDAIECMIDAKTTADLEKCEGDGTDNLIKNEKSDGDKDENKTEEKKGE